MPSITHLSFLLFALASSQFFSCSTHHLPLVIPPRIHHHHECVSQFYLSLCSLQCLFHIPLRAFFVGGPAKLQSHCPDTLMPLYLCNAENMLSTGNRVGEFYFVKANRGEPLVIGVFHFCSYLTLPWQYAFGTGPIPK